MYMYMCDNTREMHAPSSALSHSLLYTASSYFFKVLLSGSRALHMTCGAWKGLSISPL